MEKNIYMINLLNSLQENSKYKSSLSEDYQKYLAFLELKYKEYSKKSRKCLLKNSKKYYYEKSLEIYKDLSKTYLGYCKYLHREREINLLEKEIVTLLKEKKKF